MMPKAPFPWFGGKSRVAAEVWARLGDVPNYVEPFAGSLAVLLGRPHVPKTETVNDLDCYLANFWGGSGGGMAVGEVSGLQEPCRLLGVRAGAVAGMARHGVQFIRGRFRPHQRRTMSKGKSKRAKAAHEAKRVQDATPITDEKLRDLEDDLTLGMWNDAGSYAVGLLKSMVARIRQQDAALKGGTR